MSESIIQFPTMTSAEVERRIKAMDHQIARAIEEAKAARVPQGLVIAILHAHAQRETQVIIR